MLDECGFYRRKERKMYILIDYTKYYGGNMTMAYDDFADLKDSVIDKLDGRGWSDKADVDLRSADSCVRYLTKDAWNVSWRKSKSFKKYNNYRYGAKARAL